MVVVDEDSTSVDDTDSPLLSRSANEQLRRWADSETNKEKDKLLREQMVKFRDSDIFMSACMSCDEDEVEALLSKGASVDTAALDGLTALHQAVIDGSVSMVKFLLKKGANINAQDNEGWTPLHAAACCNKPDIVHLLCEAGADLTLTNSDMDLPIDLAETDELKALFEEEYRRRNIDTEQCRRAEENAILADALKWHASGFIREKPHPQTGATALHVAAAKGYLKVINILLQTGADVNARDKDGWTPLHAAVHWGEREAAQALLDAGASVSVTSTAGQTPLDVADQSVAEWLEDIIANRPISPIGKRSATDVETPLSPKIRHIPADSVTHMPTAMKHDVTRADELSEHRTLDKFAAEINNEGPEAKVQKRENEVPPESPPPPPPSVAAPSTSKEAPIAKSEQEDITHPEEPQPPTTHAEQWQRNTPPVTTTAEHRTRTLPQTEATSISESSETSLPTSSRVKMFAAPGGNNASVEAEAERKAKSKRERHSRRSTQGITAEQLAEATALSATVRKSSAASITSDGTASTADDLDAVSDEGYKITPIATAAIPTTSAATTSPHEQSPASVSASIATEIEADMRPRQQSINATVIMPVEDAVGNEKPFRPAAPPRRKQSPVNQQQPPRAQSTPSDASSTTKTTTVVSTTPIWRSRALEQAQSPIKQAPPTFAAQTATIVSAQPATVVEQCTSTTTTTTTTDINRNAVEETKVKTEETLMTPSAAQLQRRHAQNPNLQRMQQRRSHERRSTGSIHPLTEMQQDDLTDSSGSMERDAAAITNNNNNRTVIPVNGNDSVISPTASNVTRVNVMRNGTANGDATETLSGYANRYPTPTSAARTSSTSQSPNSARATGAQSEYPIDYRKLYERERLNNERLQRRVADLEQALRAARVSNGHLPSNVELPDEVEQLRGEIERLKQENGALIRVISKLSK